MRWDLLTVLRRGFLLLALGCGVWACFRSLVGDTMMMWFVAVAAAFFTLCSLVFEVIAWTCQEPGVSPFTRRKLVLLAVPVLLGFATTNLPLQIAFALSKSSLEDERFAYATGTPGAFPRRAGMYTVHRIDTHDEGVRLVIDRGEGNPIGFCYYRSGVQSGFNPWDVVDLGDGWFLVHED